MKLLIIDDNVRLAERMKSRLATQFVVDLVDCGEAGLQRVTTINYSVIILDLRLPDISGKTVCQELREMGVQVPILILTGVSDVSSRVELLNAGADDYLVKPFDPDEFFARVAALSRRQTLQRMKPTIRIKDLVIDTDKRWVSRAGTPISLRRKEFDILEYLVNNRGRVLTREMILNHAWDSSKVGWSSTVDVHIKYLRDKIDRPFDSPLIRTAYGVGYTVDALE